MIPVPADQLVPGRRYYIQDIRPKPGDSGKKIGTFVRHEPNNGFGRVYFRELSDISGAKMPSGLGWRTENYFSENSATFLFFDANAKNDIIERFEQRAFEKILGQNDNPHGVRDTDKKPVGLPESAVKTLSSEFYGNKPPPGGGKRSRRRKKSRKSRKSKRSRRSRK